MLRTYGLIIILLAFFVVNATAKRAVGFTQFSYNHKSCDQENALTIYNYVVQAFNAAQRFTVLDRLYGTQVVAQEQEDTKDEIFMGGKTIVDKGRLEGAEWMVSGQIIAAEATQSTETMSDGTVQTKYYPNITFFLRIYDVVTGELIASEIITPYGRSMEDLARQSKKKLDTSFFGGLFESDGYSVSSSNSPQAAISEGMRGLLPVLTSFVKDNFPFELEDFKVEENDYGETKVMARVYQQMGTELGQIFEVIYFEKTTFGDEVVIAKRVKCELIVDEVAGSVIFLVPRSNKDTYIYDFIRKNTNLIRLRESGGKAIKFNPFSTDKETKERRQQEKEKRKAAKRAEKARKKANKSGSNK